MPSLDITSSATALTARHERLTHLLEILQLPQTKAHFNMRHWGSHNHCQTSACVLGHAAFDPKFQQLGLLPSFLFPWATISEATIKPISLEEFTEMEEPNSLFVLFENQEGAKAGARFFGLTDAEADFLFAPTLYPNKPAIHLRTAQARVKWLMQGKDPTKYPHLYSSQVRQMRAMEVWA